MKKEFKVLNLTISKDHSTGLDNLLAILYEIETFEIEGLQFAPVRWPDFDGHEIPVNLQILWNRNPQKRGIESTMLTLRKKY